MSVEGGLRVAVLGGGHGAYASAADLAERGHRVRLWRRDGEQVRLLAQRGAIELLDIRGQRDVELDLVSSDLRTVVEDAELVLVPLPSPAHEELAVALAPCLSDGQVVFLAPGNLGAYVFAKALRAAGGSADVLFAEGSTLPYFARKSGPTSVTIFTRATRLSTGFFPSVRGSAGFEVVQAAYDCTERVTDILDAALINLGFVLHVPVVLLNAGAIEAEPELDGMRYGGQPSVRAAGLALDAERIAVREALGYPPPHFTLAALEADAGDDRMYANWASEQPPGARTSGERIDLRRHRFVTEDLTDGLTLLVSLAARVDVPVPVAQAFCTLGATILDLDFQAVGRTLQRLGLESFDSASLQRHLKEGFA